MTLDLRISGIWKNRQIHTWKHIVIYSLIFLFFFFLCTHWCMWNVNDRVISVTVNPLFCVYQIKCKACSAKPCTYIAGRGIMGLLSFAFIEPFYFFVFVFCYGLPGFTSLIHSVSEFIISSHHGARMVLGHICVHLPLSGGEAEKVKRKCFILPHLFACEIQTFTMYVTLCDLPFVIFRRINLHIAINKRIW